MNISTQSNPDDLARLLHCTLSFSSSTPAQQFLFPSSSSSTTNNHSTAVPQASPHYYASTHYYHPSSLSTERDDLSILRSHDINPSHLFPSQLDLFSVSPAATRLRLLELWRTAPIRAGDMDAVRYRYGELHSTDLLQEEVMTRLRLNRDLAEQRVVASTTSSTVMTGSGSGSGHGGLGGDGNGLAGHAEPYMLDGYGAAATAQHFQSQASSPGMWSVGSAESNQAVRTARDFDRLQALHAQVSAHAGGGDDDEMML